MASIFPFVIIGVVMIIAGYLIHEKSLKMNDDNVTEYSSNINRPESASQVSSRANFCTTCGTPITLDDTFCSKCGKQI